MSYTIYFWKEKEKKKRKRAYETFSAASSNYFRKMYRKVKCLKIGIFDICPFVSLKLYQQFFHVFNLMCQMRNGRKTLR